MEDRKKKEEEKGGERKVGRIKREIKREWKEEASRLRIKEDA